MPEHGYFVNRLLKISFHKFGGTAQEADELLSVQLAPAEARKVI